MKLAGIAAGLVAGALFLPASAQAFSCAQVIWAVQTFSQAEIEAMAARFGGITASDRAKAHKCLREANAKGVKVKAASVTPVSTASPLP